jgi:hypothetical protein
MPEGFWAIGKSAAGPRIRAGLEAVPDIRRKPGSLCMLSCNGVRGRLARHPPGAP